ncbi:MAG: transporter [Bacteroidetes bacterium MED-G13]|nr:transporter [Flavobacteriaceae bacterium]PDH46522.1 MAG: transporter [Bacteroidetes bacterium MED-G13]|tara:strand:- start:45 stop:1592 length:1548 start_codon:yes stop_codon:yes gene_type:complete
MKINHFFIFLGILTSAHLNAQDIYDALEYTESNVSGTARFNAMSGAFSALGGDISSVFSNPAGSAVLNNNNFSFSLSSNNYSNENTILGTSEKKSKNNFGFDQIGGAIIYNNINPESKWKKIVFALNYNKTNNNNNRFGVNNFNNENSIDGYFLSNSENLRLDQISAYEDESITQAYAEIGSYFGYAHQQAFLGYYSYILEPNEYIDDNVLYSSNIPAGNFSQSIGSFTRGNNGVFSVNFGFQYDKNLFLGINLNSHVIDRENVYLFNENNENSSNNSVNVTNVYFENRLSTYGEGFSFQLGLINKISDILRLGISYQSPTWFEISEESSQYIETIVTESDNQRLEIVNPNVINIFEEYKINTPSKLTASLAIVFKNLGLISFDYSNENYENLKFKPESDFYFSELNNAISTSLSNVNTYRVGSEILANKFSFRMGYFTKNSPFSSSFNSLNNSIDSTDGFSFGIGYKMKYSSVDFSVQKISINKKRNLFDTGLTDQLHIENNKTLVSLSFSTIF